VWSLRTAIRKAAQAAFGEPKRCAATVSPTHVGAGSSSSRSESSSSCSSGNPSVSRYSFLLVGGSGAMTVTLVMNCTSMVLALPRKSEDCRGQEMLALVQAHRPIRHARSHRFPGWLVRWSSEGIANVGYPACGDSGA
jgi:hypothetical protein